MPKILFSLVSLFISMNTALAIDQAKFNQGRAVYEKHCIACHNYMPPPRNAPPLVGISGHYHQAFTEAAPAIAHIADFIKNPAPEKSKLPPMAINAWGLMPPLTTALTEEEIQAVAYWVWAVYPIECTGRAASMPFCRHFQIN